MVMSDCCPPAADPWTCCATVCADVCRAYRLTAWEGDIFIGRSIRPWPFIRLEVMTVILGACVTVFLNIRSSLKTRIERLYRRWDPHDVTYKKVLPGSPGVGRKVRTVCLGQPQKARTRAVHSS